MDQEQGQQIAADEALCWMCERPTRLGDEPGTVRLDNGHGPEVEVCSEACTRDFFAAAEEESGLECRYCGEQVAQAFEASEIPGRMICVTRSVASDSPVCWSSPDGRHAPIEEEESNG